MRCQNCGKLFDKVGPDRIIYVNEFREKVCPECYMKFGGSILK